MEYVLLNYEKLTIDDLRDLTLVFTQLDMSLAGRAKYAAEYTRMLMSMTGTAGERFGTKQPVKTGVFQTAFLEDAPPSERRLLLGLLEKQSQRLRERQRIEAAQLIEKATEPLREEPTP
jgi:hypothetical protein